MKKVDISPKAHEDLAGLKIYLTGEFGDSRSCEIIDAIYDSMEKLSLFPESDIDLLARYGIASDYRCLITNKNYVFYRIDKNSVKIIRILDERRDFLQVLFGIGTSEET